MENTFNDLQLKTPLIKAVKLLGFESPTPIQSQAIPLILESNDILGQAQTGTGKTAAFGLPILNALEIHKGLQALVICPTRELAVQVAQELSKLGQFLRFNILPVYGGQSIEHQIKALHKKPEIIVGTPGRLIDHLNRGTISFSGLKTVVLDEADEMLDMGFLEDMTTILKACPKNRQTLLFSATMSDTVMDIAKAFMNKPVQVAIKSKEKTVSLIEQRYYEVNPTQKIETLCRILDVEHPEIGLIFCRTKQGTDELAKALRFRGYSAEALHGDLSQRERDSVMQRFRQGNVELLVATDVAARGLDVNNVTHVINYDIPQDIDTYVHRVGRTGRAGKEGIAITLIIPREVKLLRLIERHIKKRLQRFTLPTLAEAVEVRQQNLLKRIKLALADDISEYMGIATTLMQENNTTEILASLIKLVDQTGRELETAELKPAEPETTQVKLPMGRRQGANPKKIIEHLTTRNKINIRDIGNIQILDHFSLVELPVETAHLVKPLNSKPSFRQYKKPTTKY